MPEQHPYLLSRLADPPTFLKGWSGPLFDPDRPTDCWAAIDGALYCRRPGAVAFTPIPRPSWGSHLSLDLIDPLVAALCDPRIGAAMANDLPTDAIGPFVLRYAWRGSESGIYITFGCRGGGISSQRIDHPALAEIGITFSALPAVRAALLDAFFGRSDV
jgi:hypothetical protein